MLSTDWITEKHIDFEYKKYLLLAYLQEVDRHFGKTQLYPYLPDLKQHHKNLNGLRESKKALSSTFQKELVRADLAEKKLVYEPLKESSLMAELDTIIEFSLPRFQYYIGEGDSIREEVEQNVQIEPVGLVPLYTAEGYLMLKPCLSTEAIVYQYAITIIDGCEKEFPAIRSFYVSTFSTGIGASYESIKRELIKSHPELPNPATFIAEAKKDVPVTETLLPIARQMLVRYVANVAG